MTGCIVGWAHSKFGKHEGRDVESLIVEVAQAALVDAGVAAADIDTIYLGTMNGGFVRQEFPASLVFQADPALRFKPATRVEDACATGSAAIHQGLNAIAAGRARLALIVGVEKMTEVSGAQVGDILLGASYRKEEDAIEGGFAGIFGKIAQSYFQRYATIPMHWPGSPPRTTGTASPIRSPRCKKISATNSAALSRTRTRSSLAR